MKARKILGLAGIVVLVAIVTMLSNFYTAKPQAIVATAKETAFDRVMRTGTLRCGYAIATPWSFTDPNTNQLSGVDYDVTNAIADKMGLKIVWAEETGWGTAEQGLADGRYDVMCGSVCIDTNRTRAATFSDAFVHIPLVAVVRDDDHRFDPGLATIDKPDVRIGVKDGHVFEYIAKERFPNAQRIYATDLTDDTQFLLMLTNNKIDIAFAGQSTVDGYNQKNPQAKVRSLPEPARYCHGAFMVPLGDYRMRDTLNAGILQMNTGGQLAKIIQKYTKLDPLYVRLPALPFQESNQ